ncbi:MAG: DUF2125 domain-containing protein [Roseobacter sp.]
MRRLGGGAVVLALVWSAWWIVAMLGLRQSVEGWLEERRAASWQAEASALRISGYPTRLDLSLEDVALADPVRGLAVGADSLQISSAAWWPGHSTLSFPATPIAIAVPGGRADLAAENALAALRLHPGQALELDKMSVSSGAWFATDARGDLIAADDLSMLMVQSETEAARYSFEASVSSLTPGQALRDDLRTPESWPLSFDALSLDMEVLFDRRWDLAAIEGLRPQPRAIALKLAEASWGSLQLRASGDVTVDDAGLPEGVLSLQVRNWRQMVEVAEATGALPSALRSQTERVLAALAGASGNPDAIDVSLTLANGVISLGFIPLAPAPRLILR